MGFEFDNISSQEIGISARITNVQAIPQLKNSFGEIAGKHGILDFGNTFDARKITIHGTIFPQETKEQLQSICDSVSSWLNPEKGVCPLFIDGQRDRYYMARLESGIEIEKGIKNTATFSVDFICPDPFAYATHDEIFEITENAVITRTKGNISSNPIVEINGVISNQGYISLSVNGEIVKINGPLTQGQTFILNSQNLTAIIKSENDIQNALGKLENLVFPSLKMGDNIIEIIKSEGTVENIKIYTKSRWL